MLKIYIKTFLELLNEDFIEMAHLIYKIMNCIEVESSCKVIKELMYRINYPTWILPDFLLVLYCPDV